MQIENLLREVEIKIHIAQAQSMNLSEDHPQGLSTSID
ncbi:hypothetical protein OROMI_017222 [Orobanche minor]